MEAKASMAVQTDVPEDKPRRSLAMALMVVSSVGISFGGLIVRSMDGADPWQVNFYRSISLGFVVLAILVFRYRRLAGSKVRSIGWPGMLGGAFLSVAGISFLQALEHTTVANTLFVLSAIPFFTAGLAWLFLHENLQRATLITMCFAAVGICLMVVEGISVGSAYGNLMALITAIAFASFAVIVRSNRQVDMLPSLLVSSAIIFSLALAMRWDDLGITVKDVLLCFLWGGVLSGVGNALFIFASRHLVAAELTLFMLLEFALGPVWVWMGVGEVPTRLTIIGGIIVIFAVTARALAELRRGSDRKRRSRPNV